jgi:hypothetical protein
MLSSLSLSLLYIISLTILCISRLCLSHFFRYPRQSMKPPGHPSKHRNNFFFDFYFQLF